MSVRFRALDLVSFREAAHCCSKEGMRSFCADLRFVSTSHFEIEVSQHVMRDLSRTFLEPSKNQWSGGAKASAQERECNLCLTALQAAEKLSESLREG